MLALIFGYFQPTYVRIVLALELRIYDKAMTLKLMNDANLAVI